MERIKFELSSYVKRARHYLSSLNKSDQERLIGSSYIVLSLFAIAFFGVFAIYPTLGTIANLKRQYEDNLLVDEQLDKKISALSQLETQYATLESEGILPLIKQALPFSPDIPAFTRKVETIAKTHRVTITLLSVGSVELFPAEKIPNEFIPLKFSITIEGSRENTNAFAKDVTKFDRIISLESQILSEGEETEQSVNISGVIYFSK